MRYLIILIGYLLGSIPFGFIVSKYIKGINITQHGSGNIGFTNVLRTVGLGPAIIVLIGDIGKGAVAAWLGAHYIGEGLGILCGVAAMLGHSFSIFLKFKGGKLVATSLGVLIVLAPQVALIGALVWVVTLLITRYVSLSSILAGISVLPSMFVFNETAEMKVFLAVAVVFLIYRHKSNVSRLLNGTEYKIGQKTGK